jgi:hypothetical protein
LKTKSTRWLSYLLISILVLTFGLSGMIGCKTTTAAETTAAAAETTAAAAETTAAAAETTAAAAETTAASAGSFWERINAGEFKFPGVTINYLYQGGVSFDDYLAACATEFEKLTGIKVVMDPTPWEAQMPKIVNDLTTGANRYDVFEGDIEFQYGLYNYMEEITPYIEKYGVNMDGYFKPMYTFGEWSGKGRFGLPISTGCGSFVIRKDIFDAAGITYPFATWDDYYAALAKVNDPANGIYGTAFAGVNAQLVKMWLARYWGQGVSVYSKTWAPQVNSPEGVKATQMLVDLMQYAPKGVLGWDLPEAASAFLDGKTATYESWYMSLAGKIDDPTQSKIANNWLIIPAPGGGPTGNWTEHNLDLLKGSKNKDAAFLWMAYVTSAERQLAWANDEINKNALGFEYARTQPWTDVLLKALPSRQGQFDANNNGIPITPGLPQWLQAFMAIGENNGGAMSGVTTPEKAMEQLQAVLQGIIESSIPPFENPEPNAK